VNVRRATVSTLGVAVLLVSVVAQATAFDYYTPPKTKVRGTATTPIAGAGTVVVQVFVTKSGAATKFKIVKSTNPADNASALEIAKSSTYAPATKGSAKQDAFYDYTLKFTISGIAADPSAATGVGKYKLMISSGNYSGAQAGLKTYLAANPGDSAAELQLGIADQYLNDPVGAAAAFDKAGTIPPNYASVAVGAYSGASAASFKSKDFASAAAYAKKSVALAPGPFTYNALGTAEDGAGQSDAAIADLETARKLAAADATFKPEQKATIDDNLVSAYVNAGKIDSAKEIAAEATKLDPTSPKAQTFLAQYYVRQASDAQTKGNYTGAAGLFEQAAGVAAPADQPNWYAQAALAYLKTKDNGTNDKAKADADKALAIAPDNALANLAAGISLANQGSSKYKDALVYFNKADASAKIANNTALATTVESLIKQVSSAQ
jgi:Tfp pilus assembly protein PilF